MSDTTVKTELGIPRTQEQVAQARTPSEFPKSATLFEEAKRWLPSGASSNVRVYRHDPHPLLFARGEGSRVWDVDGNEFVDYLMAYGALILGHRHPRIVEAIRRQLDAGTLFGTTTELEIEVAKLFSSIVPGAEMVSFTNSGTEATLEAIRIARAYTGRDKIIKFEGQYHGHHDYVLFSVESPAAVAGLESYPQRLAFYPGIPEDVGRTVIVAPWGNMSALERLLKKHGNDVAAIITEPIVGSAGVIPPDSDYLKRLKEITTKNDALLIFDEVLTGFRVALGGAQQLYGVAADLACFAKALGAGVPIAAVSGRRDVMGMIGPGKIGYGGTYNANPIGLAASRATLELLKENNGAVLERMNALGQRMMIGLQRALESSKHSGIVQGVGAMLQLYFTRLKRVATYRQSWQSNLDKYKEFRDRMVRRGIYFHPDGMERLLLSTAHTENDIDSTIKVAEEVLRELPQR